jgi:hypothetical protein
MVVQYIEQDIDRQPHYQFHTSYRVVNQAQGSVRKIHLEMAESLQERKLRIGPQIETLRRNMALFAQSLELDNQTPEDIFPLLKHSDTDAVLYFDESVGPIVTTVGSGIPKECFWRSLFHKEGEGSSSDQAAAESMLTEPSTGPKT